MLGKYSRGRFGQWLLKKGWLAKVYADLGKFVWDLHKFFFSRPSMRRESNIKLKTPQDSNFTWVRLNDVDQSSVAGLCGDSNRLGGFNDIARESNGFRSSVDTQM